MTQLAQIELVDEGNILAPFNEVAAAIKQYGEENANIVFLIETPKGLKDAKSHIAMLRKVKARVSEIHKEVKREALTVCRHVDGKKNEYTGILNSWIDVHLLPIKKIEQDALIKKQERIRKEQAAAQKIEDDKREAMRKQQEDLDKRAAELKEKEDAANKLERDRKLKAHAAQQATEDASEEKKRTEKRHQKELQDQKDETERKKKAEQKETDRIAAVEAERVADADHRKRKIAEAIGIFCDYDMPETYACRLADDIAKDLFPVLKIVF